MKRLGLIAMLLLGSLPNAYADNDVYDNIAKHRRGGDVLQADTSYCSQMLGARRPRGRTVEARGCARSFAHLPRSGRGTMAVS